MLRRKIADIESRGEIRASEPLPTGHEGIDTALGGGLGRGRLHEVFATERADASSAAGFTAMLARQRGGSILWLRADTAEQWGGRLHPPGLAAIGIDLAALVLGVMPDPLAVLRAAADAARCPDLGAAVIELWRTPRQLDLTASRRLALAAETSGVTLLMLRAEAEPAPSAAQTRWSVRAAASTPLEAAAPGHSALEVTLLRQRGRPALGEWLVEWDREQAIFREQRAANAALSGAVVPVPSREPADADVLGALRRVC